jgi:hypothetical protein
MSINAYENAVRQTWRHTDGLLAGKQALQHELVCHVRAPDCSFL